MPMFTKAEIEAITPDLDGTYVWNGSALLADSPVTGFEVGYDEILNAGSEVESVFLQYGDRIGRWTSPEGRVVWDRTAHVIAPFGVAWSLAESFSQECIFDWSTGKARGADGCEV